MTREILRGITNRLIRAAKDTEPRPTASSFILKQGEVERRLLVDERISLNPGFYGLEHEPASVLIVEARHDGKTLFLYTSSASSNTAGTARWGVLRNHPGSPETFGVGITAHGYSARNGVRYIRDTGMHFNEDQTQLICDDWEIKYLPLE